MIEKHLDTRGFLSFLILWLLREKKMSGRQLREELAARKGHTLNSGTIYPALKALRLGGLVEIEVSEGLRAYHLTDKGAGELAAGCAILHRLFPDFGEIEVFKASAGNSSIGDEGK